MDLLSLRKLAMTLLLLKVFSQILLGRRFQQSASSVQEVWNFLKGIVTRQPSTNMLL